MAADIMMSILVLINNRVSHLGMQAEIDKGMEDWGTRKALQLACNELHDKLLMSVDEASWIIYFDPQTENQNMAPHPEFQCGRGHSMNVNLVEVMELLEELQRMMRRPDVGAIIFNAMMTNRQFG